MPETITRLKVFVSSPSNLDSHRATVNKVLEDLSHDFGQDRGIEFRVFNWERDAVPGISSDPQAVISGQLEYDIYIGLLGTVFGSPTPRAGSGTEEEFLEAYGKYLRDSTSVRVLFYFEKLSNEVFQIDLAQLGKVQQFRRKLGPQGVLRLLRSRCLTGSCPIAYSSAC